MKAEVTFYGQLTDFTGKDKLLIEGPDSLEALKQRLYADFPQLKDKQFIVAVNNKIVKGDVALEDDSQISLLPPFSGG